LKEIPVNGKERKGLDMFLVEKRSSISIIDSL